jgi:hypothetical protein
VDLAYSRPLYVSSEGVVRPLALNLEDPLTLRRFLCGRISLISTCVVHRRRCFEQHGYIPEDLPHSADSALWRRIIRGAGRNVAYCGVPTSFHFRAIWRSEGAAYRLWLRLRRLERSILPELSISVDDGEAQQEAVWRRLEADPAGWAKQLRSGVRIELDRLARAEFASILVPACYQLYARVSGNDLWT